MAGFGALIDTDGPLARYGIEHWLDSTARWLQPDGAMLLTVAHLSRASNCPAAPYLCVCGLPQPLAIRPAAQCLLNFGRYIAEIKPLPITHSDTGIAEYLVKPNDGKSTGGAGLSEKSAAGVTNSSRAK
jgi:hypothetical protein